MKRFHAFACILALLVGFSALAVLHSSAKPVNSPSAKTKATKVTDSGEDSHIKTRHEKNSRDVKPPVRPYAKGGRSARGSVGQIHVDNRTPYSVYIYNNGDEIGKVGAYGDLYFAADAGDHDLYGRAFFEDGNDLHWGTQTLKVYGDRTSTWTLTD